LYSATTTPPLDQKVGFHITDDPPLRKKEIGGMKIDYSQKISGDGE
jgi:hypothetical protein